MSLPVCTHCEEYEGVLMVTTLTDGDTQVICPNDILLYALTLAATISEGMTLEQAEAYAEQLDRIRANDPRHASQPPSKRSARANAAADDATRCPVCKQTRGRHSKWCSATSEQPPDGARSDATTPVALVPPCDTCGGTTATGDAAKLVCDECGAVIATEPDASLTPGGEPA